MLWTLLELLPRPIALKTGEEIEQSGSLSYYSLVRPLLLLRWLRWLRGLLLGRRLLLRSLLRRLVAGALIGR